MKKMNKKLIPAIEYSIQNPNVSVTKVGILFNVDRHMITKYKKNNLYKEYKYKNQSNPNDNFIYSFSEDELKLIQLYLENPTMAYDKICEQVSHPMRRSTLYRHLKILGKEKTEGSSIKYHYDRTRFKNIETEEDAYWLGFITADGCILDNKWLSISLAARDRNHLVKFCHYMGLSEEETQDMIKDGVGGAYTRDNPINNVKFCSVEIVNNLKDKGIIPRKSGKEKPYFCSNKKLELAYIRGLIDGDGYLGSTQYRFGIVGSLDICKYVQNFIDENIVKISRTHIYNHDTIFKFALSGRKQSSIILTAIYGNASIYLDRKYQLFMDRYNNESCRDKIPELSGEAEMLIRTEG